MEAEGAVTCGTVLDQFVERKEVRSIVASLPQTCKELRDRELTQERFTSESLRVSLSQELYFIL